MTAKVSAEEQPAIHQRVWDLLRQMRGPLLDENLISREEYAWLVSDAPNVSGGGSPAPRRLETYDEHEARRRDTEQALAAAQAQVREAEWLPIATAPKDGTTVLLGASGLVEVGYWQDFHKAETECGVPVECDVDEGWYGSCDFWPSGKQPTHWQPLPPPPARLEQERTA